MSWPESVRRDQLRIEYYRGSGKGGQKRNKTSSACRITHLPTGHVAACENHRGQTKNREEAFRRLAELLVPLMREAARVGPLRKRVEKRIRSYHEPRGEVTDHRVSDEKFSYSRVLDGDLGAVHLAVMAGNSPSIPLEPSMPTAPRTRRESRG
jgi:peptide chain release factor 1